MLVVKKGNIIVARLNNDRKNRIYCQNLRKNNPNYHVYRSSKITKEFNYVINYELIELEERSKLHIEKMIAEGYEKDYPNLRDIHNEIVSNLSKMYASINL